MIGVAVLILTVLAIAMIFSVSISRNRRPSNEQFHSEMSVLAGTDSQQKEGQPLVHPYIAMLLTRWTTAGILTDSDAERIRDFENRAALQSVDNENRPTRGVPAIAEALGYLGGVLGVAGVIALISAYWSNWTSGIHLAVAGGTMVILVVAGFAVSEEADPALARLRWFIWTGATPAMGIFAYVVASDVLNWDRVVQYWIVIALGVGILNGVLWAGRRRPIQEAIFFVSLMVAIGTVIGSPTDTRWAGVGVWAGGFTVILLTLRFRPVLPAIPVAIGATSTVVGAYLTVSQWEGRGFLFVALSASVLIGWSTTKKNPLPSPFDVLVGAIGVIGLAQSAPGTLVYYASDAGVVTGLVLGVLGVVLLVLARLQLVRVTVAFQIVGGVAVLVGPAITGVQSTALATMAGFLIAIVLIALGMIPGQVLLSMLGLAGLLAYVPWTIAHFFPGEGRAPLLITVSGLVIVVVAVVLARMSGRIRTELQGPAE